MCSACAAPTASRGPQSTRPVDVCRTDVGRKPKPCQACKSATGRPSCTPEAPAPRARRWTERGVSPVTPDYFLLKSGKCSSNTLPDFSPICQIRGHRLLQTRSIFCDLVLGGKGGRLALLLAALLALLLLGLRPDVVLGGRAHRLTTPVPPWRTRRPRSCACCPSAQAPLPGWPTRSLRSSGPPSGPPGERPRSTPPW